MPVSALSCARDLADSQSDCPTGQMQILPFVVVRPDQRLRPRDLHRFDMPWPRIEAEVDAGVRAPRDIIDGGGAEEKGKALRQDGVVQKGALVIGPSRDCVLGFHNEGRVEKAQPTRLLVYCRRLAANRDAQEGDLPSTSKLVYRWQP